ncbi:MAG: histidinol dehydrogenase, partial [Granulosicoccus sp.]|nr:histidinol dehydrogenase [Granulosicoccus sp.]
MSNPVKLHEMRKLTDAERDELLRRTEDDLSAFLDNVDPIIEAVKLEGDEALARFAREFDKADVSASTIAVTTQEIDAAFDKLDPAMIETL